MPAGLEQSSLRRLQSEVAAASQGCGFVAGGGLRTICSRIRSLSSFLRPIHCRRSFTSWAAYVKCRFHRAVTDTLRVNSERVGDHRTNSARWAPDGLPLLRASQPPWFDSRCAQAAVAAPGHGAPQSRVSVAMLLPMLYRESQIAQ
ncbi:unnamed protein product [Lampetra planeri]